MPPQEPAEPYKAALINIRLLAADALARAARAGHPGDTRLSADRGARQLHLVTQALEEIADIAGSHPQMVALHSAVLDPEVSRGPSAFADVARPPGIMDTIILMIDYCNPNGERLSAADGQRVVTQSAERLNNDLGDLGWVDCIDLGSSRGATVYLVGPDRLQLWNGIEPALKRWAFRPMTALLRPADRRRPDMFQRIHVEPEIDNDPPADLVVAVMAAMPQAMIDIPTPQLRAVSVHIMRTGVAGRFIYAEPPGMDEQELVSLFETYLWADFTHRPQLQINFVAVHLPADQELTLQHGEKWFYRRNEDAAGR